MEENSPVKYFEDYLHKKEGDKKWIEYWAVVCEKYLIFYKYRPQLEEYRDAFQGCIELTGSTKCIAAKRKNYSFPFYIITQKARYLVKTQSTLSRHQWFQAIELSSQGRQPRRITDSLVSQPPQPNAEVSTSGDSVTNDEEDVTVDIALVHHESEPTDTDRSVLVVSCAPDNQTSRFLERKPLSDEERHCNETDLELTELEEKPPDLDERLYKIYCGDNSIEKLKSKPQQKPQSYIYEKPMLSQYNPSYSTRLKPSSYKISRLVKSAEMLRDIPATQSYERSKTSLLKLKEDCGSLLRNFGDVENITLTKSRFSRHIVNSAPDVKMLTDGGKL